MSFGLPHETMRSAVAAAPGGPGGIRVEEVARPALATAHDILVQVVAAGVGLVDLVVVRGGYEGLADFPRPVGLEFVGRVVATGAEVTRVSVGDHVCGMVLGAQGALSDYLVVPDSDVGLVPPGVTLEEAATLPSATMTAYAALHLHPRLQPGDRALILSAASGVGVVAVQMAVAAGAVVHAAAGSAKEQRVLGIGAHRFFGTTGDGWREALETYDVVVDPVGGRGLGKSYEALRPGGRLVCLDASSQHPDEPSGPWVPSPVLFDPVRLVWDAKTVAGVNITALWERDGAQATLLDAALAAWRAAGVRPCVAAVHDLDEVAEAFARVSDRSSFGRVVVRMGEPHRPPSLEPDPGRPSIDRDRPG